jgi:hypothetical protein
MFAHVSSIEDWKTAVNFLLGRLFSTLPYFGLQILWQAQSGNYQASEWGEALPHFQNHQSFELNFAAYYNILNYFCVMVAG